MTVQEIFDQVRFEARADADDADNTQLFRLLNNAVVTLTHFVAGLRQDFLLKQGTSINLVAGTSDYLLATDILQLKRLQVALDGSNFYAATPKDLVLDTAANALAESRAQPRYVIIASSDATEFKIRIEPTPAANVTNGIQYFYVFRPAVLTLTSETPVIPTPLHEALSQIMISKLKKRSGDLNGMGAADQKVASELSNYKSQVGQRKVDDQEGFDVPIFTE